MPNFVFHTAYENGKTVERVLQEKKRTIFWFLRYIGCPTCRYDVHMMAVRYQEFLDNDTQIFVVMQSQITNVREELKDMKLPFDIICDPEMKLYESLEISATACKEDRLPTNEVEISKLERKKKKVKELGFVHGKYEGNEQQLPALFVVEQNGTVSYVHYAQNSIDMPTVAEMLSLLKK